MTFIDAPAIRRAWRFPLENPAVVLAAAILYAIVFTAQSWFTAQAQAGDAGAAPLGLLAGLAALFAFILAMSAWARAAYEMPEKGLFGLAVGGDEGRLAWSAFLVLILSLTVLGTAFLAVAFMIAALALINVDPEAPPPEAGEVDLFGLFGPGEMMVAAVIFLVFAVFCLWFFLRLAMAYPATMRSGQIKILSVWPLSGKGRSLQILSTVVAAAAPGVVILALFNLAASAFFGAYPASAQSAAGEAGALVLAAPVFWALAFVYGVGKAALVGAPVCSALCSLYDNLRAQDA
jgi:hypothetical protein